MVKIFYWFLTLYRALFPENAHLVGFHFIFQMLLINYSWQVIDFWKVS